MGFDPVSFMMGRKAGESVVKKMHPYAATFDDDADWTQSDETYVVTVAASTHGRGMTPMADVYLLNGTVYEKSAGYPNEGWTVSVDENGDVTLTVTSAEARFAGRMLVW